MSHTPVVVGVLAAVVLLIVVLIFSSDLARWSSNATRSLLRRKPRSWDDGLPAVAQDPDAAADEQRIRDKSARRINGTKPRKQDSP